MHKRSAFGLVTLFFLAAFAISTSASPTTNPFKEVMQKTNIYPDVLKNDFPQLYKLITKADYTIADVNSWISNYPKEWKAFNRIPAVVKLNTDWAAIGIKVPTIPQKGQ